MTMEVVAEGGGGLLKRLGCWEGGIEGEGRHALPSTAALINPQLPHSWPEMALHLAVYVVS